MIRNSKGFTLIELMVVIVIIGILAALAIPKFMEAATKAKFAEVPTVLASYDHGQLAYVAEKGAVGLSTDIVFDAPSGSKWFSYADGAAGTYNSFTLVALGNLTGGERVATTIVDASNTIDHQTNNDAVKYLVNFDDGTGNFD